jgi:hypothetical protein
LLTDEPLWSVIYNVPLIDVGAMGWKTEVERACGAARTTLKLPCRECQRGPKTARHTTMIFPRLPSDDTAVLSQHLKNTRLVPHTL